MKKAFTVALVALALFLGTSEAWSQSSWGDQQTSGVRESVSTGLFTPGRQAFDGNVNTPWQLSPGATSGWVERYWAAPQRIAGASVNLTLPKGSQLQFSYLGNGNWVPIPGAVISGPQSGVVNLTFPGEMPLTTKVLTTLTGSTANQAQVFEISYATNNYAQPFGKILPQSYTFNQSEYINLKPSRLWSGIIDNPWFSPLWSFPWEVFQTNQANLPTGIFPPYYGNPPQDGSIVWQLDGTYTIQTLKAYFIQNYQSIQFDFWNGSAWTNSQTFGAGWSDSGQGWQRIDLKSAVTTNKIRITFPGGWGRAAYIGQVEVWGQGWSDTTPQALAIPAADTDGSYHFTLNSTTVQDYQLEITVGGATSSPLTGQWNGSALSVNPSTWIGEDTVYRVTLPQSTLRTDAQFLKLVPNGVLHSVVFKNGAIHGLVDLGYPYNDGQFENTTAGVNSPVPSIKSQSWNLGNTYQLEKLRVYTDASNPGSFSSVFNGRTTAISWTNKGSGWWEATLNGVTADHLSFESSLPITLDEIQLWGTPLKDTTVGLEIWWPQPNTPVTSGSSDSNSVIGWMGDSGIQPLIGGYHPRQANYLFWMPLNQMGLAPGQQQNLTVQATLGSLSAQLPWTVQWQGSAPAATLVQGTSLLSTTQATTTISGTVSDSKAICLVNGSQVSVVSGKFSTSVALSDGFQFVDVQIWNHQKTLLEQEFIKPVYKTIGQPVLQFDQPAGNLYSQSSSMTITGKVGNGLGLAPTLNGNAVTLNGNVFTQTVTLKAGGNNLAFVLKDNAGRETDQTLTINQDSITPTVQIQSPTAGQYLYHSQVTFQVAGSPDSQMWWQTNGGDWQPGYTQMISPTYTFADGFYTYTFVAQDRSGNFSAPAKVSFCVDTTPPLPFTIGTNVSGWTNNNTPTLTFATTDATSGVDHYEALIDNGAFAVVTSPYTLPTLADGLHTIYIKAVDKAGNTTIESTALSIDTTPPPTPTNFTQTPGLTEVDLAWTQAQEPGVLSVVPITFIVQRNPAWSDGATRTSATASYNDTGLTTGAAYSYSVIAVDAAGNVSPATAWISAEVGLANVPISTAGATTVNFNQASVTLPANSTDSTVTSVQIDELPIQYLNDQPTNTLVSSIFQFRVTRNVGGTSTLSDHADFTAPVSFQMTYDPAKIPAGMTESNLKPFYYDDLWGRWIPIDGAFVNTSTHQVSFQTNHFTDYSVQATTASDASPQQLRDVQYSPFGTPITHAPVSISPDGGVLSTSFMEFSLAGKNGFNLSIKRSYDTGTAQSDASGIDASKDGSYPWYLGYGWRVSFPFMKWSGSGLWITDLNGTQLSFNQANMVGEVDSGNQRVVTLVNHENSDSTFQLTFQAITHYNPKYYSFLGLNIEFGYTVSTTYQLQSAKLFMKDGRETDFDGQGRVISIADASGLNKIIFTYSGNQASSISDSMGRNVSFTYEENRITTIKVSGGGEAFPTVIYTYQAGNLMSAVDIGARTWSYSYTPEPLTTTTTLLSPPQGYIDEAPTTTTVSALSSVSGPGFGTSNVTYQVTSLSNTDNYLGYNFKTTFGRLFGKSLSVLKADQSVSRTTSYQYTLLYGGSDQFYTGSSSIDDERVVTATSYNFVNKVRLSLSSAPEALKNGLGFSTGQRTGNVEIVGYPGTSTITGKDGTLYETQIMTWDTGPMRLKSSTTSKSVSNLQQNNYTYDTWGNTTQTITTSQVGSRANRIEVDASYYNTGSSNLALGSGLNLSEPALTNSSHSLLAVQERLIDRQGPNDSAPVRTQEYSACTYTNLGQTATTLKFVGNHWAQSSFQYDPSSGELIDSVLPGGQETAFTYDYSSNASQYVVTATQKAVAQADGTTRDLSTANAFRTLTGTNIWTKDARNFYTQRTFDYLGRVTHDYEPGAVTGLVTPTRATNPTTDVVYDDTALTSTVTDPLGLVTKYSFDSQGRLTEVDKTNTVVSPLLSSGKSSETITTTLEYDGYNEVVAMHGPVSTSESDPTRTLGNLTTTYTYDALGREISEHAPGASKSKTFAYDDSSNTTTSADELNHQTIKVADWNGKVISQSVLISGQPQTAYTYYDGAGRVVVQVDPNGNMTTRTYNTMGLESVVDASPRIVWEGGKSATVTPEVDKFYNDAGFLTATTQALAGGMTRETDFVLNGLGQVNQTSTKVTVGGQLQTVQVQDFYDEAGNKLSEVSGYAGGPTTTKRWTYDSRNRVLTATDEEGHTTTYSYDIAGNRTGVTDPRQGLYPGNFTISLQYDQMSRLIQGNLPCLSAGPAPTILFAYDGRGNLVKRQEPDGQQTAFTYTLRNLAATKTLTDGTTSYTTQLAYDAAGRQVSTTSPSGRIDTTLYDEAGRVLRQGNATVGYTTTTYYPNGTKKSVADGKGNTTTFVYNPEGKVVSSTDAKGNISTVSYDRMDQTVLTADAEKNQHTFTYDEMGRLATETTPWGGSLSYSYDAWGDVVSQVDARGTVISRTFSPTHRLTSELDTNTALGQSQSRSFTYDEAGYTKSATDNGVVTTYNTVGGVYQPDPYGLVENKTDTVNGQSLTMVYTYDNRQRTTGIINPDQSSVSYTYNQLNQLTTMLGWVSGSVGYDQYGRPSGFTTINGIQKSIGFNNQDQLANLGYAVSGGSSLNSYAFTYDQAGNIVGKNSNTYSYDQLNQLMGTTEAGWFQQQPKDIQNTVKYGVSPDRDYTGVDVLSFNVSATTIVKLDIAARSVGVDLGQVYGFNKLQLSPTNTAHRVRQQDISILISSDNQNYVKLQTSQWTFAANPDGSITIGFPKILQARFIKVNSIWDDRDINNKTVDQATFTRSAQQLIQVWVLKTSRSEQYTFDAIGNRTSLNVDGQVQTLSYYTNASGGNLPWVQSDGTWNYTYDQNGNMISKSNANEIWNYGWDLRNRLVSVTKSGSQVARYTYNVESLRVQRTGTDGTTYFAYGLHGELTYQTNSTTGLIRTLVYLQGQILGWTDTRNGVPNKYFASTDHLGSVTKVTDSGQLDASGKLVPGSVKVVWSSEYQVYGKVAGVEGVYDFRGLFTGKDFDQDTGLIYFNARWYNPDLGRFISEDPAGQGVNLYAYCANSPLTNTDPSGKDWGSFWSGVSAVAVGVAAVAAAFIPGVGPMISGAIVGAYLGGSVANHSFSFGQWNWSSGNTWAGMALGAGIGALGGFGAASVASLAPAAQTAVEVGTAMGAYTGGEMTNGGQLNPLAWNWSSPDTWAGIGIGGVIGGYSSFAGYSVSTSSAVTGVGAQFGQSIGGALGPTFGNGGLIGASVANAFDIAAGAGVSNGLSTFANNWVLGDMSNGLFAGNFGESLIKGTINAVEGFALGYVARQSMDFLSSSQLGDLIKNIPTGLQSVDQRVLTIGNIAQALQPIGNVIDAISLWGVGIAKDYIPYATYQFIQPLNSYVFTNMTTLEDSIYKDAQREYTVFAKNY